MDSRIIMLIMALTTFIAYPLLSDNDRKQVAPLATPMDEPDDEEEPEDDGEPVMMDEDDNDEVSDLQLSHESQNLHGSSSDQKIGMENQQIKSSSLDPQLSKEDDEDFN